jgi:hypothetical protein
MANVLHESGRNAFLAGTANWVTGKGGTGVIQAALVHCSSATTGIKAISGTTTGAAAAAVACTAHGYVNGDVVNIVGVGGTTTANQLWVVSGQTTNAFNLTDPITGTQGTLVGAYTSGGFAVNLGPSISTWAGYSANLLGTAVTVTSPTEVQGIASGANVTFTSVPVGSGFPAVAIMLIATASAVSGTLAGTDIPIAWIDGQMIVTAAAGIAAATALPVERIPAPIASGVVLAFSDGNTATLSGAAAAFARSLAVASTTITATAPRASAPATGSGLPVTPNGGNISVTWDSVGSQHVGIFKL